MSFTKAYFVELDMQQPTLNHIYSLVNAGNSRGALQKFLFHLHDTPFDREINTEFVAHKDDNFKGKVYINKYHTVKIYIQQINPHSDFIYLGGIFVK
jgi:hypothetical protein